MTHAPPPWQPNPPHQPSGQFPPPPPGFPAGGIPPQGGQGGPPPMPHSTAVPAYGQPAFAPPRPPTGTRVRRVLKLMINPWKAAQLALRPQNRLAEPDARIEQIRLIRTLIGMAVVAWVALKYDSVETERIVTEAMLHITVSVVVAVVAVPVVALILVLMTDDSKRRDVRRSMRVPMKSMGYFFGAGAIFAGCTAAAQLDLPKSGPLFALVIIGGYAFIWCGIFAAVAFFLVPRHLFAAADGHLLMPSLLAPTLSWAVAAVDLSSPGNNRVPLVLAAIVTLGAPVSITAMSVWEAKRTKDLYGVSFRGGTEPTRMPAPATMPVGGGAGGAWLTQPSAATSWNPMSGGGTTGYGYGRPPFNHVPHVVGFLFTCGMWTPVYLIVYLRWRSRNPAPQSSGGWY